MNTDYTYPSSFILFIRSFIGLLQGLWFCYLIHLNGQSRYLETWILLGCLMPILFNCSVRELKISKLILWLFVSFCILIGLSYYNVWRAEGSFDFFSGSFYLMLVLGFFIAESLILAGSIDRSQIAHYPTYFDQSWKLFFQLCLSALFTGVMWLLIWLSQSLFSLIGLSFLEKLIQNQWFSIPITTLACAFALHFTDLQVKMTRGIRNLVLILFSCLMPVFTLVVLVFLGAILVVGLKVLFSTRFSASLLLSTSATLIILINTVYREGEQIENGSRIFRHAITLASLTLFPLNAIVFYGLFLRIQQHGLTVHRIYALCCLLVSFIYALGYSFASLKSIRKIEKVNIANSFLILIILFCIFSPIADPARIAVNNQMNRLLSNQVDVKNFNFNDFRYSGGRFGKEALQTLSKLQEGKEASFVREKAEEALNNTCLYCLESDPQEKQGLSEKDKIKLRVSLINLHTEETPVPSDFLSQKWEDSFNQLPECLTSLNGYGEKCDAWVLKQKSQKRVLILTYDKFYLFQKNENSTWKPIGYWDIPATCSKIRNAILNNHFSIVPPTLENEELKILDFRLPLFPSLDPKDC